VIGTLTSMEAVAFDLRYDPNEVGPDLVVECRLSRGRPGLDLQPGDLVTVGDDEEPPVQGRVLKRDGDWVTVQLFLPRASHAVA